MVAVYFWHFYKRCQQVLSRNFLRNSHFLGLNVKFIYFLKSLTEWNYSKPIEDGLQDEHAKLRVDDQWSPDADGVTLSCLNNKLEDFIKLISNKQEVRKRIKSLNEGWKHFFFVSNRIWHQCCRQWVPSSYRSVAHDWRRWKL